MHKFQLHPATRLVPPGAIEAVQIDNEMLPLIQSLWARGRHTMACCQNEGEAVEAERTQGDHGEPTGHRGFIEYHRGWAWLKMPATDTLAMLAELRDHASFGPRVQVRWQRGSWRMHIPVIDQDGRLAPAPCVQIYFPMDQITELTEAIAGTGPASR